MDKKIKLLLSEAASRPIKYPSLDEFQEFVKEYRFSNPDLAPLMNVVRHPLLWAEFFLAARCWWEWRLWETVGREEIFTISARDSDPKVAPSSDRIVSTMGLLGQSFGVQVFDSEYDFEVMSGSDGLSPGHELNQIARGFSSNSFEFVPFTEVSELNRCLLKGFNIEPVGPRKLVPELSRYRRGYMPVLPVERVLLELINVIRLSLHMHTEILSGRNPWEIAAGHRSQPDSRLHVGFREDAEVLKWIDKVSDREHDEHPIFDGGDDSDLDELESALLAAEELDSSWQINWGYMSAMVGGERGTPPYVPVIMLAVDSKNGLVISVVQGGVGDSIAGLLAGMLAKVAQNGGMRPRELVIPQSFRVDSIVEVLEGVGCEVIRDDVTLKVNEVFSELHDMLLSGRGWFD